MSSRVIRLETDVDGDYGECPLLSTIAVIPKVSPMAPGQVDLEGVKLAAPCLGPGCGWWSQEKAHCAVLCISEVANKLDKLTPSNGGGALSQIADNLGALLESRQRKD